MTDRDDGRIALYLDGGMDEAERSAFERELAERPELAEQVERWRANDERLRAAFELKVPDDLAARLGLAHPAAVEPAAVIDLASVRAGRAQHRATSHPSRWAWAGGGAVAAGMAAAIALLVLSRAPAGADPFATEEFQVAMQQLPSRQAAALPGGREVTPTLSFADADGRFCREFAIRGPDPRLGIACRSAARWRVEGTAAGTNAPADTGEIRAAAGADAAALDAIYRRLDASDPFDAEHERQLIARGWQGHPNGGRAPE